MKGINNFNMHLCHSNKIHGPHGSRHTEYRIYCISQTKNNRFDYRSTTAFIVSVNSEMEQCIGVESPAPHKQKLLTVLTATIDMLTCELFCIILMRTVLCSD
jgi:hypothetical protein